VKIVVKLFGILIFVNYLCIKIRNMGEDKVGSLKSNELFFVDFIHKLAEKLTLITLSIKEQKEIIPSDDMDFVLKPLHKVWFMGEMPFYKTEVTMTDEKVTQGGLFDKRSDNSDKDSKKDVTEVPKVDDGTKVEPAKSEPKKKRIK
jgi:hypothetical protein